jgi:hypothetical protein
MNYDIKDIIFLYKEITDLATSYYEIADKVYNFMIDTKEKQNLSILIWEDANHLNNPIKKNIINYVTTINKLCRPQIINKLNFLREHTQIFNNDIIELFLYCINEPINFTNIVDIKKYICEILIINFVFLKMCNFLYDLVKNDILCAKLDVIKLQNKIDYQLLIIKSDKINCYFTDNNLLYKKMFNLKKQIIERKIAELEAKRIKLYLNIKYNTTNLRTIKYDIQQINKIAKNTSKLILKINK